MRGVPRTNMSAVRIVVPVVSEPATTCTTHSASHCSCESPCRINEPCTGTRTVRESHPKHIFWDLGPVPPCPSSQRSRYRNDGPRIPAPSLKRIAIRTINLGKLRLSSEWADTHEMSRPIPFSSVIFGMNRGANGEVMSVRRMGVLTSAPMTF
jgi:hypothetical protein